MVKAGKKSATKVIDAPAVTPSSKSIKKGKREAEGAIEKIFNAKKQKTGLETKLAVPVKKPEVKTQKKKKEESSSSEDSSSEKDEKVKVVTKKAAKPPVKESDSDDSSSDEEAPPMATAPDKQTPAKNGKVDSSSDSSDDESDEEPPAKAAVPPKKQPGKAESSSSDSSDDESDEDEKPSAKAALPLKMQVDANNGSVKKVKAESSSSDEDDDDSSSDEEDVPKSAVPKAAPQVVGSKKADSSDSSDGSDSDDEKPQNKAMQQNKMDIDKDGSVDESSDESENEKPQAQSKQTQVTAKKESSSDEESSEESSDDEEKSTKKNESSSEESSEEEESDDEKPAKTPKKNATDVEMVDASHTAKKDDSKSAMKTPQTPATPTGSKTLFVGNLSYDVEREDVENFFKEAGEILDVRFAVDKEDQRFKGFGHVEFETAEGAQKALKLNGKKLNGREVRLDLARERGAPFTPHSGGNDYNSFQKGGQSQGQKVYVRGFDRDLGEDKIRESLEEHFKACGGVSRISIPTDRETGSIKGMAYLEFQDSDGYNKALELNNSEFGNHYLTVEEAKPRSDGGRGGGFSSNRGRGGRGGGSGRRGGRDGGGRGGRGRGGGRGFSKPSITTASAGKRKTFDD